MYATEPLSIVMVNNSFDFFNSIPGFPLLGHEPKITDRLTNTSNVIQTVVYTVTPVIYPLPLVLGSACGAPVPQTVTITIVPRPTMVNLSNKIICSGSSVAMALQASIGSTFTWTRNAVTGIAEPAVTNGTGDITEVLTNTTSSSIDVIYTVMPVSSTGSCIGIGETVTVTVKPTPDFTGNLTPSAICSGANFSYTPSSSFAGATFAWTRAVVTGISNAAGIDNGDGQGLVSEVLMNTTAMPIAVTYAYVTKLNNCEKITNVTVMVNPIPVITINAPSICEGQSFR